FELLLQAGEVERLDLAAGVAEGTFGAGAEAGELLLDGGDGVAGGVERVGHGGADRADVEQVEHRLQAVAHVLDQCGERGEGVGTARRVMPWVRSAKLARGCSSTSVRHRPASSAPGSSTRLDIRRARAALAAGASAPVFAVARLASAVCAVPSAVAAPAAL